VSSSYISSDPSLRVSCSLSECLKITIADPFSFLYPAGDDIIPIPGTTKYKNYDENMDSLKVQISKEDNEEIRKAISNATVVGGRYPPNFSATLFADTVPLKQGGSNM
jgi:hypothetical protein